MRRLEDEREFIASSFRALCNRVSLWRVTKKSISAQLEPVNACVASAYFHPLGYFAGIHRFAHLSKEIHGAGLHRALFQPAGLSFAYPGKFQPNSFPGNASISAANGGRPPKWVAEQRTAQQPPNRRGRPLGKKRAATNATGE
jgi:hypothetical protein